MERRLNLRHNRKINMKKTICILLATIAVANVTFAQAKKTKTGSPSNKIETVNPMKNGLDSFSYAVGVSIAMNMKDQGIEELNLSLMSKAFDDVFKNKTTLMKPDMCNSTLQQKLQEYNQKKSAASKEVGTAFLAENKKKPGVITLPNGLQYEVMTAGDPNGKKPIAADTVVVHYVGTLIDGKEFDNSVKRGEPATFPLGGVIRGWTEILQQMTVGAKWKVYIPSELGYGERGAGGQIPPHSTLIFEINLLGIKPAVTK
jgi:FKBP-type peptidyl-prolyl cis-trans isomerase FklB